MVFRNDPLESLKVSSTFDSIPFVRDYLQNEIEKQLRTLMMDELPAIIHRLSLRLWCPEYKAREDQEIAEAAKSEQKKTEEVPVDPFASPPQDAVDARGNVLDASEISSLSLDGGSEIHSLFSQKNLLRLAALTDSHRTLSLFTPSIRDTVFRAWSSPAERNDSAGPSMPGTPNLSRTHSTLGSTATTYTFDNASESSHSSRPSLVSFQSARTGLSLGAGNHSRSHAGRKKKTRVVNLRRSKTTDDISSVSGDSETSEATPASEPVVPTQVPEEPEDNVITPPRSPASKVRFRTDSTDLDETPRRLRSLTASRNSEQPLRPAFNLDTKNLSESAIQPLVPSMEKETSSSSARSFSRHQRPTYNSSTFTPYPAEKSGDATSSSAPINYTQATATSETPGSILEQAWVLKMAGELARRAHDEKVAREGFWSNQSHSDRDDTPPPAYEPAPQL